MIQMTNWKTAHCPCCGREMPCYYSLIDEELTMICNHCETTYKIREKRK